jgi:hypothetical protein
MTDETVSRREFDLYMKQQNGSLQRIERDIAEVKTLVKQQNDQVLGLLDREIKAREDCEEKQNSVIEELEKKVTDHDTKLKVSTWVWRGIASVLGLALVIISILAAVHVI